MAGRGAAIASDSMRRGETESRKRTPPVAVTPPVATAPTMPTPPVSLEGTPLTVFSGVGSKTADTLAKLGLLTIADLLNHYPRRYEDRAKFASIAELQDGQTATVVGVVTGVEDRYIRKQLVLTKVSLDDGSRKIASLTWFNQRRMKSTFEGLMGKRIVVYGTVKRAYSSVEFAQPEWEPLDEDGPVDSLSIGRIVPVYPATEGIHQRLLRKIAHAALTEYVGAVAETLPDNLRKSRALPGIIAALWGIHFPETFTEQEAARRRLAYDELLVLQLLLAERRREAASERGITFADVTAPVEELRGVLPFSLTDAQNRVVGEIAENMATTRPMNRLVQGDVGSGKTAVAMAAMTIAARNGYQAALMAPTEILAEQHLRGVRATLEELGIRVDLLTGSRPAKEKAAVRERVASGETGVVVGTHALIQEGVNFHKLGLAVIDEQHRFGVMQRAALVGKGGKGGDTVPDVLVMTATPIPRTLTLTVYGDLDVSVIDQLPPGRKLIRTHWKKAADKESVYNGVRKLIQEGRQAFVVCPLVEESEKMQARAATELAAHLTQYVFPEYKIGLLHGQLPTDEKDAVMKSFRAAETQILVATTVIEVGVDIPNAAVMVIEDADRFGLAQLHQLRGRVGRGQHASFCILIADPKTPDGIARMRVMTETTDGFRIAEEDLRLRGPGEFFGVRQSGLPALKAADVLRDTEILKEAREDAFTLIERDPRLSRPEHRQLRVAVERQRRAAQIATVG